MKMSHQSNMLSLRMLSIPIVIASVWGLGGIFSTVSPLECFLLVVNQSILGVLVFIILVRSLPRDYSTQGPGLVFIFSLHVLIYYGASNLIPSLLPELRPENLYIRVPPSSAWAYALATISALFMLLGVATGAKLASFVMPVKPSRRSYPWLPGYRLSMTSGVLLLLVVIVGTVMYGAQVAATTLTDEDIVGMGIVEQLLFHGLFDVLPISPLLAASAFIMARERGERSAARLLLVFSCMVTLLALLVWGQRSTAMLALALPVGLLVYTRQLNFRKIVLPVLLFIAIVYSAVTMVRESRFIPLLVFASDIQQVSFDDMVNALGTKQSENDGVAARAVADLSYRTAGLEAVAALISAQVEGALSLKAGATIVAGFQNALPASIRPERVSARVKTGPASYGIFMPGDWVTSILAEFVLDFGPWFLFFPAMFCGALLMCMDHVLLLVGQYSALEGILILRIIIFVFIIANGGSLADMTLMLVKGSVGYVGLFVFVGFLIRASVMFKYKLVLPGGQIGD